MFAKPDRAAMTPARARSRTDGAASSFVERTDNSRDSSQPCAISPMQTTAARSGLTPWRSKWARLSAMCMHLIFEFDRYSNKASVTDAALGDYMPSELADVAHRAPQHRYLHATVVIEVKVKRRKRQLVMLVKGGHQPLGQIPRLVVIDIDQGRHAIPAAAGLLRSLLNSRPRQVPDGLGAVLVSPRLDDAVEIVHEVVVDRDGYALHGITRPSGWRTAEPRQSMAY